MNFFNLKKLSTLFINLKHFSRQRVIPNLVKTHGTISADHLVHIVPFIA
jgi:hypothetical protein